MCVWNGDEIPTPDEMAGYAQNAHVLYRTYSSSFQDLQQNVNVVVDLLILIT